jgi:baculoviral IAP repeat-containing protein 6 (apollon)
MPHSNLKTVFTALLTELKRVQQKVPALPIAAAVNDRLGYLLSNGAVLMEAVAGGGVVDRALMYSESARRDTFAKWPHSNYK